MACAGAACAPRLTSAAATQSESGRMQSPWRAAITLFSPCANLSGEHGNESACAEPARARALCSNRTRGFAARDLRRHRKTRGRVCFGSVAFDAIATGGLGAIERGVGAREQSLRRVIGSKHGKADRAGHCDRASARDDAELADARAYALGKRRGVLQSRVGEDRAELFA